MSITPADLVKAGWTNLPLQFESEYQWASAYAGADRVVYAWAQTMQWAFRDLIGAAAWLQREAREGRRRGQDFADNFWAQVELVLDARGVAFQRYGAIGSPPVEPPQQAYLTLAFRNDIDAPPVVHRVGESGLSWITRCFDSDQAFLFAFADKAHPGTAKSFRDKDAQDRRAFLRSDFVQFIERTRAELQELKRLLDETTKLLDSAGKVPWTIALATGAVAVGLFTLLRS